MRIAYTIELTAEEYRSACYMCDRGYLGELTAHATETETSDDERTVTLGFTEPDAWAVNDTIEQDPDAVWALTTPSTTLGKKFTQFINSIV